jgi:hypothetical protein
LIGDGRNENAQGQNSIEGSVSVIEAEFTRVLSAYKDFRNGRLDAYEGLISKADSILEQQHEQDRLRPPDFNIFRVLGNQYREVSTHSAMLAHLLDPNGGHAQGVLFLRAFLSMVEEAAANQGRQITFARPEASMWRTRKRLRFEVA